MNCSEGENLTTPLLRRNRRVLAYDARSEGVSAGLGAPKRLISAALSASAPSHDLASPPEVHNRL